MLRIRVWGHGELDTEIQVRPDGTITLPLIGDVSAAERTPTELRAEIVRRLRAYIRSDYSQVTVAVVQIQSYRVTVSGNVNQPGVLRTSHYLTVGEAIALAGGPSAFAVPEETVIVRTRPGGNVDRIPIRYDLIMQGLALEQDIVLLRGDLVYVP